MKRVAVIGGGIAGLSTAYRLIQKSDELGLDLQVTVIEAGTSTGGKVATANRDGYLCEAGPQGFLDNEPATLRLVDDLKLRDQLLRSSDTARERYILHGGKFHLLQASPLKFMTSGLLSVGGRLNVVKELFRPPRTDNAEETVAQFGERRLGPEFTNVMLDSMVSGIHAGDIHRLSLRAAFPKIANLESNHGGLIKGMMAMQKQRKRDARKAQQPGDPREAQQPGDAREARQPGNPHEAQPDNIGAAGAQTVKVEAGPGGTLYSFRDGMSTPITALTNELGGRVRTGTKVAKLARHEAHYRLFLERSRGDESTLDTDAIILAVPAHAAAEMLKNVSPDAATALSQIPYAGVHVVCLGYRRDQIRHPLRGFGALIPRSEGLRILGTLWVSSTFDGHAPDDRVLLRTLVGGRHDPSANDLSEDELVQLVRDEIEGVYGISGEPQMVELIRWPQGIPQYELGHLDHIAAAKQALEELPGIFLTGNSVCGISFNQCVAHSELVSTDVANYLSQAIPSNDEART